MPKQAVSKIREFNRFYMPMLGLLGNRYLGSEYSPTEARVLFEIYEKDGCNAAHIAKIMNIDKSYLSRVLKRHEESGYLVKIVSANDSRSFSLHLTEYGNQITLEFIKKSNEHIEKVIAPLDGNRQTELIQALCRVITIFNECNK